MTDSEKLELIHQAVIAQAEDPTLWAVNFPGEPFQVSIGEAYVQQSLRWLHQVIENADERALASILEQSEEHNDQPTPKERVRL